MNLEQTSRAGTTGRERVMAGLSGAAAVTLAHEVVRQLMHDAPRMDRLGMVALARGMRRLGLRPPRGERLRGYTLLGDLAANAVYYAPIADAKRRPLLRGLGHGVLAGLGAIVLPPVLGLPRRHAARALRTQLVTIGLYTFGGLVAGAVASYLGRDIRAASRPGRMPRLREPDVDERAPVAETAEMDVVVLAM